MRWLIRRCSMVRVLSLSVTFCQYRSPCTLSVHYLILLSFFHIGKCLKVTINVFLYYHFYIKAQEEVLFYSWTDVVYPLGVRAEPLCKLRPGGDVMYTSSSGPYSTSCRYGRGLPLLLLHCLFNKCSVFGSTFSFGDDDSRHWMFLKIYLVFV